MFFVVERQRLVRMLDLARDDKARRARLDVENIPYLRIAAHADGSLQLSGLELDAKFPATVHRPGVLFLRAAKFRQVIAAVKGEKWLTVQASDAGVEFDNVCLPIDQADILVYADPATAPQHHPGDRQRASEQHGKLIAAARKRLESARDKVIVAAETMLIAERELHELLGTEPDVRQTLAALLEDVRRGSGTTKQRRRR